jgi:hypothetical protein
MLLAGGFLFVGYHTGQEGIIKVWNVATGASHMLPGHKVRGGARGAAPPRRGPGAPARPSHMPSASASACPPPPHPAPQGQIYDLATANNMLFSSGQDGSIRVWSFNQQGEIFMCSVGCWQAAGRLGSRRLLGCWDGMGCWVRCRALHSCS